MTKELSLKDAFIYSLFLHILFVIFLGTCLQNYINFTFLQIHKPFIEVKDPKQKHLSFRFINVPNSVPVQELKNKDLDLFSDRASRVEGDKIPKDQPIKSKSEEPFSIGTVKEKIISSIPSTNYSPQTIREQKIY